jgi:outer membrane protein OmpA-like peptidoglycan-associated protein
MRVLHKAEIRNALGRTGGLPSPLDLVYRTLAPSLRPDINRLLELLKGADKCPNGSGLVMQTMLLFETPPPLMDKDGNPVYRPAPLLPPEKPTMNIPPALMFMIDATQREANEPNSPRPTSAEDATGRVGGQFAVNRSHMTRTATMIKHDIEVASEKSEDAGIPNWKDDKLDVKEFLEDCKPDKELDMAVDAFKDAGEDRSRRRRFLSQQEHFEEMKNDLIEQWAPKGPPEIGTLFTDPRILAAAIVSYPFLVKVNLSKLTLKREALSLLPCWRFIREVTICDNWTVLADDLEPLKEVRQLRKLDVSRTRSLRHIPLGECHMLSTLIARDCPWLGYRNAGPEKKLEKTQARRLQRRTSKDLDAAVPRGPPVVIAPKVTTLVVTGCHKITCFNAELPVLRKLDLSRLESLTSITPKTPALEELNCSFAPALKGLDASLFAECPVLKELTLRGCEELLELNGLEHAKNLLRLRVSRCVKLHKLRWTDHPRNIGQDVCPLLRYADFHACHALGDEELFQLVGDVDVEEEAELHDGPSSASASKQSPTNLGSPGRGSFGKGGLKKQLTRQQTAVEHFAKKASETDGKGAIGNVRKVMLKEMPPLNVGDVVVVKDYWQHPPLPEDEPGTYRIQYLLESEEPEGLPKRIAYSWAREDGHSFETLPFEVEEGAVIVWPSQKRADAYPPLRTPGWQELLKQGCRSKFRKAAMEAQVDNRPQVQEEMKDAFKRAEAAHVIAMPLLRGGLKQAEKLVPDLKFPCFMGCGKRMTAKDYMKHEAICPSRQVLPGDDAKITIPRIGARPEVVKYRMGIAVDKLEEHVKVREAVEEQCKWWNPGKLSEAITTIVGPDHHLWKKKKCTDPSHIFPHHVIVAVENRQRRLQRKYEAVRPLLPKKAIEIDFDTNRIEIKKPIAFAKRKPPDSSAEFDEAKVDEALETISDLAIVIANYMERMVVEGHTGGASDPISYWEDLANSRAQLIVDTLVEKGVRKSLLVARGEPGGGAKVAVFPANDGLDVYDDVES